MHPDWIVPAWPADQRVRAFVTTRQGGVSAGPFGLRDGSVGGLNLGLSTGDSAEAVAENRARVRALLPGEPVWLRQVHGARVVDAEAVGGLVDADAAVTREPGVVLAIQVADCMPVLFSDREGSVVGAAHAGWRGLAGGVLEATIAAMGADPGELLAYLGPAIGPNAFEVGRDVLEAFSESDPEAQSAFIPKGSEKWFADLGRLAERRLEKAGVKSLTQAKSCTVSEPERFYSYRRDRVTGRMAAFIWLEPRG